MTSKKDIYVIEKKGVELFKGSYTDCYRFILGNQPHSSAHALKNGYRFKKVEKDKK